MRKTFEELTQTELWGIRKQIVLNSIYIADYDTKEGYNPHDLYYFFDGYIEYLYELMDEDGVTEDNLSRYDNSDNLWGWFCCYDDLSWIRFEEDEE